MHRVLYVGDPHARPDCLEEVDRLVGFVADVAKRLQVNSIVFLGDQFHTHSVVHLSVLSFWQKAFKRLAPAADRVFALVGNHDMSGKAGDQDHALMLYDSADVHVVRSPHVAPWNALLVPYYANGGELIEVAKAHPSRTVLVCHQTFDGSKYENGFFAKDGVDLNLIPQQAVVSGHIHTPQQVGKVWYPGSPRWQTISDANTERAIWVVDHNEDGTFSKKVPFDTSGVCRPIFSLVDREGEPLDGLPEVEADLLVDVYGSQQYVKRRAEELQKLGARVRQFPETTRALKVRESEGLPASFKKYIGAHKPKYGTERERLMEMATSRISWLK